MRFGILYNTDYYPEVHGSAARYYSQILDQVQIEEELGFSSVWFGEHHYSGYSFGSPPVMAMAAANRTKKIKLGTGVSLVPLNHPIRLAEEYAMLDVLSGGRLEYGIGRGFLKYSHAIFGINEDENHERYHEGTDIIVKAWTSTEPFSYEGKFWRLRDYTFFPKPLQQPHPPIYASAVLTPESASWAGKMGFHLTTGLFVPAAEKVRNIIKLYREALAEHGHDPRTREVSGVFQLYCGASNEEARREGGRYALQYFKFFSELDRRSPHTSKAFEHYGGGVSRVFEGKTYEDLEKSRLLMIGDPEYIIEHIKWAEDFYGVDYLIFEVAQGGEPHDLVVKSLERFAKHVMPAFEASGSASVSGA